MTEKTKKRMLELLADDATSDLNESELLELKALEREFPEWKDDSSFEYAAASIGLLGLKSVEPMPKPLRSKVLADADSFFGEEVSSKITEKETQVSETPVFSDAVSEKPAFDITRWLGWGLAAAACLALVANVWLTRFPDGSNIAKNDPPSAVEKEKTATEKRDALLASTQNLVKTNWSSPDKTKKLEGEVIWSDEKQEGYMTFKGLEANDKAKEAYQLWIFRDEKLEPHPIDGGVFDVNKDGEVVIPIDAKLKVKSPKVFAVTVEKPGGVVVSGREKIVALAKV